MKLPIKFRVIQMASENDVLASNTILETLQREYPNEKCVSYKNILGYLQSLRICGLINSELTGDFDDQGTPIKKITITDYGKSRLGYISLN